MSLQLTMGGVNQRWVRGNHPQARTDQPSEIDGDAGLKAFAKRFRGNFLNDCTGCMGWCHGHRSVSKRPVDCPGQYNSKGRDAKADDMSVHDKPRSNQWLHFGTFLSMPVMSIMKSRIRSQGRNRDWFLTGLHEQIAPWDSLTA